MPRKRSGCRRPSCSVVIGSAESVARDRNIRADNGFDLIKNMPLDSEVLHYALDHELALSELGGRMRFPETLGPATGAFLRQAGTHDQFIHRGRDIRSRALVGIGAGRKTDHFKAVCKQRSGDSPSEKTKTGNADESGFHGSHSAAQDRADVEVK